MAKLRKKPAVPEPPPLPQVGDRVYPPRSELVYEISRVYIGGDEVDLHVPGTNLERRRVRTDTITFVERKPPARTSNPFTDPESVRSATHMWDGSLKRPRVSFLWKQEFIWGRISSHWLDLRSRSRIASIWEAMIRRS